MAFTMAGEQDFFSYESAVEQFDTVVDREDSFNKLVTAHNKAWKERMRSKWGDQLMAERAYTT